MTLESWLVYLLLVTVATATPGPAVLFVNMFLTALFPQFLQVDLPLVPQFFWLIVTLMAFSFSFLMLYALVAHKACAWLQGVGRKTLVNWASGSVFVGFGVPVAGSSNR